MWKCFCITWWPGWHCSDVGWPSWALIIWNNEYYSYRAAAALARAARAGNGFCPHLGGHLSGDQRSALREFRRTISIHWCYCSPYDLNDLSLAILQEAKDKKWWSRVKVLCKKCFCPILMVASISSMNSLAANCSTNVSGVGDIWNSCWNQSLSFIYILKP